MFVRDRTDRGPAPVEVNGPTGLHYTCDFLEVDSDEVTGVRTLKSFRFTQRSEDGLWVYDRDRSAQLKPDGLIHFAHGAPGDYNATGLAFNSMVELLLSSSDVQKASGLFGHMYH